MNDCLTREQVEERIAHLELDGTGFAQEPSTVAKQLLATDAALRAQLAASEARCQIYEEAFNELQNAILDAQHILDKEE